MVGLGIRVELGIRVGLGVGTGPKFARFEIGIMLVVETGLANEIFFGFTGRV